MIPIVKFKRCALPQISADECVFHPRYCLRIYFLLLIITRFVTTCNISWISFIMNILKGISWEAFWGISKERFQEATRAGSQVDWGRSSSKNISYGSLYIAMFYMAIFICGCLSFARRFSIVEHFDSGEDRPRYLPIVKIKRNHVTLVCIRFYMRSYVFSLCVTREIPIATIRAE